MNFIALRFPQGEEETHPCGITPEAFLDYSCFSSIKAVVALFDNRLVCLSEPLMHSGALSPVSASQSESRRVFCETLVFVLHAACAALLNAALRNPENSSRFVSVNERFHDKKIAVIADKIIAILHIKLVFIAMPLSSGKTAFLKELSLQPIGLSLDSNNKGLQEEEPRNTENWSLGSLSALDFELFKRNMLSLLAGKEMETPLYDFKTGLRKPKNIKIRLEENSVLLSEGLRGLNESSAQKVQFKIYFSAFASLNLDERRRVPSADFRFLRRIARDSLSRGAAAPKALLRWPHTRSGEEKWIFPYQGKADAVFNSAVGYEPAVLKPYPEFLLQAASLLFRETQRLLRLLGDFLAAPFLQMPSQSILREFIGRRFGY